MIVQDLNEIKIVGVFDRGVPNQERIVLNVIETVNLGQYGIMVGIRAAEGTAFPIRDNLFWFGDGLVNQGDWLTIYTGPGKAQTNQIPNSESKLYSIHWGRDTTILGSKEFSPILFRIDAVQIPVEANMLPNP